jgi:hypothetical protein
VLLLLAGCSTSSSFHCEWNRSVTESAARECLAEVDAGKAGAACERLRHEVDAHRS